MVMEAPPSPQSVGREFVRQYYTLLNKAPTHLHRFYNHQSSFVHGGLDPPNRETSPVIGQKQIHQKIQQLNFRDCHAKITQVDSQATLGNGVVVQVTGELSNAGHPMRRFTQTFVLAAQSPKKYYVHNDIFRYQDEIISDEECDAEGRSEGEEEIVSERAVLPELQQPINQPTIAPYYNPNAAQIPAAMAQALIHHNQPPPQIMNAQPVATVNGAIHPEDVNIIPGQVPSHVQPVQNQGLGNQMADIQGLVQAPLNVPSNPIEEPQSLEEPIEELNNENAYDEQQEMETERDVLVEPASNEPKTYANLLKSGNTVLPYVSPPSQTMAPYQQQVQPMRQASPPLNVSPNQGSAPRQNLNVAAGNRGSAGGQRINQGASPPQQQQQSQRMPNRPDASRNNMGPRNSMNEDFSFEDRRRSQSQNFNDVNQLFLGNLPHVATEDELREIFGEFGAIVDLRVHSKPTNKVVPPGQRAPPNYGFITYESQLGVQNCLQAKPIYYPKDDKNGTLLNVEEKKNNKERLSYGGGGGRPGMDNNRGGGRGDNGNQRRMGGGPGGPNRNSSGGPPAAPGANNRNNSYGNRNNGPPNNRGPNTYNRR